MRTKAILDAGLPPEGSCNGADDRDGDGAGRRGQPRTGRPQPHHPGTTSATSPTARRDRRVLLPLVGQTLDYAFQANLLEQVKRDVIGAADLASGEIGGAVERTHLLRRPGRVHQPRRGDRAGGAGGGRRPLRGAGDASSPAAGAPGEDDRRRGDAGLARGRAAGRAALDLVAAAAAEGEEFPVLRAGIATGPTLPQSGDYYGRSVNLASRVTGIARPGSVLVDTATREAAGEAGLNYSFAGERRLKGIDPEGKLFRVRREPTPRRR